MRLILWEPAVRARPLACAAGSKAAASIMMSYRRSIMPNPDEIEHWENRYRERPPWDTGRVSAELERRLVQFPIPRGRAVEFGCGTGTNAVRLAQQGFDVTAIDISPAAIASAAAKATEAGGPR